MLLILLKKNFCLFFKIAENRQFSCSQPIKQIEFRKTFDRLRAVKLAVFGDLAAILKINQKFLFSNNNNIHLSLTMQKEILESLL